LLLLYPVDGRPRVLLTLRDGNLPHHPGQVSLPGGAANPGESLAQAALREAREETGVEPSLVRLIGRLSPLHIPVSGFALHPFVGVCDARPDFRPDAGEVERILEPALAELADPACLAIERRHWQGSDFEVPILRVEGERVWGATAMILAEFLTLLDRRPDPWRERV
jgi:8-oxo-dGTP pyrophosphatase MutT (NUDIX family)